MPEVASTLALSPAALALASAVLVALLGPKILLRTLPDPGFGLRSNRRDELGIAGAVALIGATLIGLAAGGQISWRVAAIASAAGLLGVAALLAQAKVLAPKYGRLLPLACAIALLAAGLRLPITGDAVFDNILTVAFLLAVSTEMGSPEPVRGMGLVFAGTAGAAVLALAQFAGQSDLGRLAAALTGACLGSLRYGRGRSVGGVGPGGRRFLGFLLAALALAVEPSADPPSSAAIPLILLALPIADSVLAGFDRLRGDNRRRPRRAMGSLHRLARGRMRARPLLLLAVTAQALLGLTALLAGRRVLGIGASLIITLAVVVLIHVVARRVERGAPEAVDVAPLARPGAADSAPGSPVLRHGAATFNEGDIATLAPPLVHATVATGLGLATVGPRPRPPALSPAARAGLPLVTGPGWQRPEPFRWRPLLVLAGVVGALSVPSMVAMASARQPAAAGADRARAALSFTRHGDPQLATATFAEAESLFSEADRRLSAPWAWLGRAVPFLSSNLVAARTLVDVGANLSTSGQQLTQTLGPTRLRIEQGGVSMEELRQMVPVVSAAAKTLRRDAARVEKAGQTYLAPPLRRGIDEFRTLVGGVEEGADRAAEAVTLAPALFGAERPRRYFFGVQNNAELRGTGGFMGSFGELVAEKGKVRLERSSRIQELATPRDAEGRPGFPVPEEVQRRYGSWGLDWRHVNMPPDVPTVGGIIADLYPRSGGLPLDGVILLDASGLAALLQLTGPVTVPDWPQPISTSNVVSVVTHEFDLLGYDNNRRAQFVAGLAEATWQALTTSYLGNLSQIGDVLGQATRGRHLMVFFTDPREQQLARQLGIDGSVPLVPGDSIMVVNNNAVGTKIDHFLRREIRYDVRLRPELAVARVSGRIEMAFTNAAPSQGLPGGIIGPEDSRYAAGENATLLSVLTPLGSGATTVDGAPVESLSDIELGRLAHSLFLRLPAGQTKRVVLDVDGEVRLEPGGWYVLHLIHQPVLSPDRVGVAVQVPKGWRIRQTRGLQCEPGGRCTAQLNLETDAVLAVQLERTGPGRIWDRLKSDPRTGQPSGS